MPATRYSLSKIEVENILYFDINEFTTTNPDKYEIPTTKGTKLSNFFNFSVVKSLKSSMVFDLICLCLTFAAKLSAGMKTATSLSRDNLVTKVGKISHREIRPAEI